MPDFNFKSPELYNQVNHNVTPSHYERRLDSFPVVSEKTGRVIINIEKNISNILVSSDTKRETNELNESFKKQFIEKLKKLPDFEGSKVQEAIEKGTVEIKKIPDRNAYAIYESKVGNLVYITNLYGEGYMNIDHYRTLEMLSDIFKAGYIRQGYSNIKLENGVWKLYDKKGKKIPVFSDEYSTTTLNAINLVLDFSDYILEEAKKKGITK